MFFLRQEWILPPAEWRLWAGVETRTLVLICPLLHLLCCFASSGLSRVLVRMGGHLGLFDFDTSSVPSNQMGQKEQVDKSSLNGMCSGFYWVERDFKPQNKSTSFTLKKKVLFPKHLSLPDFSPLFSRLLPFLIPCSSFIDMVSLPDLELTA